MTTFNPTRYISRLVAMLLIGLLVLPAQAATLKIATLSPEGVGWMKLLRKHGKRIEERTGGSVKMKFYPGGVMGDDKAVLRKMRVGQLHGAVITAGGLVQAYPNISLYNMPMLFRGESEVDVVRAALDEVLMEGLRGKKYVGFGLAEVGFAYPMTQRRVTSVGQLRAGKVWTPDNDKGALLGFDAFDISPIPLPMSDVLAGLQTGLIDARGGAAHRHHRAAVAHPGELRAGSAVIVHLWAADTGGKALRKTVRRTTDRGRRRDAACRAGGGRRCPARPYERKESPGGPGGAMVAAQR